jgi:hypothetical protein
LSFAGAAPQGAVVASTSSNAGLFSWTPSEAQGPGTYTITIKATDAAGLTAVLPFQITVNEVDTAPVISPLAPIAVSQGQSARIQVTARDADLPAQSLVYSLDPGAPDGAQINPQTGLLTWDVPSKFTSGLVNLIVRVTEVGGQGLSVTQPVVLDVSTGFNGFELFTTAAVQLGGFAQGLTIDSGVPINSGLTIAPFGSSQPGALPAQVAVLAQLSGIAPTGTPSTDAGTAGHLAAGIVDIVLGFDSGVPHNGEGMDIEQLARDSSRGGGGLGAPGQQQAPGEVQKAGAFETFDGDDAGATQRNDSSQSQRTIPPDSSDTSRAGPFWGDRKSVV